MDAATKRLASLATCPVRSESIYGRRLLIHNLLYLSYKKSAPMYTHKMLLLQRFAQDFYTPF